MTLENYKIRARAEVKGLGEWNGRTYINFENTQRTFRGDQTAKLWIRNDGAIIIESGKGTQSPAFKADFYTLVQWLESEGATIIRK